MSSVLSPTSDGLSFDFRFNDSWKSDLTGSPQHVSQKLINGKFTMYAANSDQISGRTDMNSVDNSVWLQENSQIFKYLRGDHNLNADVNSVDRALYLINVSFFNLIPH